MMIAILKGWSDVESCVKSSPKYKPSIITKTSKNRPITFEKTITNCSTKLFFIYKSINFHYFSNFSSTIFRKLPYIFLFNPSQPIWDRQMLSNLLTGGTAYTNATAPLVNLKYWSNFLKLKWGATNYRKIHIWPYLGI